MKVYYAIDIGGTNIRIATFPVDGIQPLHLKKISTFGKTSVINRLSQLIMDQKRDDEDVIAIGIDAPGPVDSKNGIIFSCPNIREWVNLPLKNLMEKQFSVPIALGNDANMAALGEWYFGAGKGFHDLVYITISTGIGGGVILDDQLLLGSKGLAGELGHFTVVPDGPLCSCGQLGHLEALASGPAIAKYVAAQISAGRASVLSNASLPSAKDIGIAAHAGDELARESIQRAGKYIGRAIADYLHVYNPSIVILGGGVTQSGEILLEPIRVAVEKYVMSPVYLEDLLITTAQLGDNAGLLGVLSLARKNFPDR
jgi:glucokinase